MRAGLWAGMVFVTDLLTVLRVNVSIGVLVRTATDVMSDMVVTADADENMWITLLAVLEIMILSTASEELLLFWWITFRCCSIAVLGCRGPQTWTPSYQVCESFALPVAPHCPNQEPPRAQQLSLPDFVMVPHVRHTELTGVVAAADVCMQELSSKEEKDYDSHYLV